MYIIMLFGNKGIKRQNCFEEIDFIHEEKYTFKSNALF